MGIKVNLKLVENNEMVIILKNIQLRVIMMVNMRLALEVGLTLLEDEEARTEISVDSRISRKFLSPHMDRWQTLARKKHLRASSLLHRVILIHQIPTMVVFHLYRHHHRVQFHHHYRRRQVVWILIWIQTIQI